MIYERQPPPKNNKKNNKKQKTKTKNNLNVRLVHVPWATIMYWFNTPLGHGPEHTGTESEGEDEEMQLGLDFLFDQVDSDGDYDPAYDREQRER